jgi:hypothetical protein
VNVIGNPVVHADVVELADGKSRRVPALAAVDADVDASVVRGDDPLGVRGSNQTS